MSSLASPLAAASLTSPPNVSWYFLESRLSQVHVVARQASEGLGPMFAVALHILRHAYLFLAQTSVRTQVSDEVSPTCWGPNLRAIVDCRVCRRGSQRKLVNVALGGSYFDLFVCNVPIASFV